MANDTNLPLFLDANLGAFFRDVVDETSSHLNYCPDAPLKEYVVGLLEDSATSRDLVTVAVERPLWLVLSEALAAAPSERFHRLREAGDGILLVGGLYRKHLRRVGLQDGYVVTLGQRAYGSASSLLDVPSGGLLVGTDAPFDILAELASSFSEVMTFLRAVADTITARAARSAKSLAELYELWLTERTDHLEKLLRAHGLVLGQAALVKN